ncbi:TPA: hypothetical protein ACH3X3_004464 [Trebouxia sp. C0006]
MALPDATSRDNAWASSLQVPEVTTSQVIVALSVVLTDFKLYQMARPRPQVALNMKEFVRLPIPKLKRRVTKHALNTKICARRPRTFAEILVWESFFPEAISRFEALDDKAHRYLPQVSKHKISEDGNLSTCQTVQTAADESEVRGYIFRFLEPLSNLAPELGLGFEYIGAGSNRNFCFTDLLLRECRNTDVNHLSAANWGNIEVKGAWQLSLPDNMSLGEALDHPDYCREVLPALQQAYGDAVVEEAPIFAISNYDVTFFCRRHLSEVGDKRIWASPPIAWNGASLPPRAAWLHFLAVAQECCAAKSKSVLLQDDVPDTPTSSYPAELPSGRNIRLDARTLNGFHAAGTRQQPTQQAKHATKQWTQDNSLDMLASSSSLAGSLQVALSLWLRSHENLADEDDLSELPVIKLDQLKLTMECLGSTSLARVMKAQHGPDVLVMKVFNLDDSAAIKGFVKELKAYNALSDIQGHAIPALHAFGQMAHTRYPTIVMHWAGQSINTNDQLSSHLLKCAKEGLQAMHDRHVTHGDVNLRNMLVQKDRIVFCDLGSSCINPAMPAFAQDFNMLDEVMPVV